MNKVWNLSLFNNEKRNPCLKEINIIIKNRGGI